MDFNIIRGKANLTRTADAYAGDLSVGDTEYVNGGIYLCKIDVTNTTVSPTVDLNGIGVVDIRRNDRTSLRIGDLRGDSWAAFLYDSGAGEMLLMNGIFDDIGVDTTDIDDAGGTVTLIPGTHNPIQRITGSDTLAANWTFTFGGSPKDGDRFHFDYKATMTLGVQSITIAGLVLTAAQALGGNVWVEAYYDADTTSWKATMLLGSTVTGIQQTFANKAARTAAVPDFNGQIGVQLDIDAVFQASGTSAGNWNDIIPIGGIIYANSFTGHTLAQGATGAKSNPFSTLAEAKTAALALSPTASNIIILDAVGSFNEILNLSTGAAGVVGLHYNFNNSIVDYTTNSATYTITDGGFACTTVIYGNAKIKRSAGASALGCILSSHASSDIQVFCSSVDATIGTGVKCTAGTLYVKAPKGVNGVTGFDYRAGSCIIDANITATTTGIIHTSVGSPIVNGNVTVSNGKGIIESGDAVTTGYLTVNGNVSSTNDNAIYTALVGYCDIRINGNVTASGAIAINCASSTGDIKVNNGTISNSGSGDCISGDAIVLELFNCKVSSSSGKALNATTNSIISVVNCSFESSADDAVVVSNAGAQVARFENCYIKTTDTNANAVTIAGGGTTKIFKDCTFIANGSGASIYAATAQSVRLLGHNDANLNKDANVTILGSGTLSIDSNNS